MSKHMRAVQETWFDSTNLFIDDYSILLYFEALCDVIDSDFTDEDYGSNTVFWIENGADFLNALDSCPVDDLAEQIWQIDDEEDNESNCRHLAENLKGLIPNWRQALGEDGSLRIYMDQE